MTAMVAGLKLAGAAYLKIDPALYCVDVAFSSQPSALKTIARPKAEAESLRLVRQGTRSSDTCSRNDRTTLLTS